jgi:eukaryotic-like serine/threonine-protein kinase
MNQTITLTILNGKLQGQIFSFDSSTNCLIGRGNDCTISFANCKEHDDISNHHCLITIKPPLVKIKDLGGYNGTYLNGKLIGKRNPQQPQSLNYPEHDLATDDIINICVNNK